MKIKKYIVPILAILLTTSFICSCRTHKDCRGRKKTVKTAMGGWL